MRICGILAAMILASVAAAQETPAPARRIDQPMQIPGLAVDDLKAAWTAPAAWDGTTWGQLGLGALALVGISLALDRPVDRAVRRSNLSAYDPWANRLDTLGGTGTVVIAGGAYLGGLLAKEQRVQEFGADAAFSMFVAQVGFTYPVKYLVGRSRPYEDQGPYHFKPLHGGQSFPSSQTAQGFTLAAVVSEYADNPWASVAAYSGAVLVGLGRIEQRDHYVSDVAAGAVIGTLSAKAVMLRHRKLRLGSRGQAELTVTPVWTGQQTALRASLTF